MGGKQDYPASSTGWIFGTHNFLAFLCGVQIGTPALLCSWHTRGLTNFFPRPHIRQTRPKTISVRRQCRAGPDTIFDGGLHRYALHCPLTFGSYLFILDL